jgi:hypothetical protein
MARAAVRVVRAAALAAVTALLVACGASPRPLGPSGVDGLTIPTPSPDPADFGDGVDNPWFPLAPGTVWTYRRDAATADVGLVAGVLPEHREIAGVATTGVRWQVARHGRRVTVLVRWYAQDRAGNVWWFGQDVGRGPVVDDLARRSWAAGYVNAAAPGLVERRSTVVSLTATLSTPNDTYRDAVLTRDLSSLQPTQTTDSYYARGIGLVAQQTTGTRTSDLTLLRVSRP